MRRVNWLGLAFLSPALVMVTLFFLLPVLLTGLFAFTNMSTATGVSGGAYLLNSAALRALADDGLPQEPLTKLESGGYRVDDAGLAALAAATTPQTADELASLHGGREFAERRDMDRALKDLRNNAIRKTRDRKAATELFKRSILNERFDDEATFRAALAETGVAPQYTETIVASAYTGWVWTTENMEILFALPSTLRYAANTALYVTLTLAFNVGFGLFLAITTFYLPKRQAAAFRAIWFLPRILPPVLYVLMWRWLTWDTGFIATLTGYFGMAPKNWMLDTSYHAWTAVVLINGFVGASMGMIIFSSAIRAIPSTMLHAAEVDGAGRWQQVRWIILPQLSWPILFITCYQTLSLLTSFEYILLATDGGPGRSTEVWSLAAYHTALNNYGGNLEYGLGAAFALVLVLIGIIASLIYFRLFNFKRLITKPLIEG